jgi:Flp pilus assembly protein TadG
MNMVIRKHWLQGTRFPQIPRRQSRGQAVLEVALLAPWVFFLFAGALDMGFYSYALISSQEAARAAVEYTSRTSAAAADSAGACQYALVQMNGMSNVRSLSTCSSAPLVVTAKQVTDGDGFSASSVSVTYTSNTLVPIPGVSGQLVITRTAQMMLR